MRAEMGLRISFLFLAAFHLLAGAGLMFSVPFQRWALAAYGADIPWNESNIYFIRIVGSFAFALGSLAAVAARDPLRYRIVALVFVEFFLLRNVNRHLYAGELYRGFGVSPWMNDLTTAFFSLLAIILAVLFWITSKRVPSVSAR